MTIFANLRTFSFEMIETEKAHKKIQLIIFSNPMKCFWSRTHVKFQFDCFDKKAAVCYWHSKIILNENHTFLHVDMKLI